MLTAADNMTHTKDASFRNQHLFPSSLYSPIPCPRVLGILHQLLERDINAHKCFMTETSGKLLQVYEPLERNLRTNFRIMLNFKPAHSLRSFNLNSDQCKGKQTTLFLTINAANNCSHTTIRKYMMLTNI